MCSLNRAFRTYIYAMHAAFAPVAPEWPVIHQPDSADRTLFYTNTAIIAIVVSSAVGIIFGTIPATRASQLDPVESLRSD